MVHVFSNSSVWSAFYFTYRDVLNESDHFEGGSHVHFTSNLWGRNRTLEAVLAELEKPSFTVSGVHIRFDFSSEPG